MTPKTLACYLSTFIREKYSMENCTNFWCTMFNTTERWLIYYNIYSNAPIRAENDNAYTNARKFLRLIKTTPVTNQNVANEFDDPMRWKRMKWKTTHFSTLVTRGSCTWQRWRFWNEIIQRFPFLTVIIVVDGDCNNILYFPIQTRIITSSGHTTERSASFAI